MALYVPAHYDAKSPPNLLVFSTDKIEALHAVAMQAGALAGKVSGAGGGGFMMFLVPPEKHLDLLKALRAAGGDVEGVKLTTTGAESWIMPG